MFKPVFEHIKTFISTVNAFLEFHFKEKKMFKLLHWVTKVEKAVLSLNKVYENTYNVGNK